MAPPKVRALAGSRSSPYDAADYGGEHTSEWRPSVLSPDVELNPSRDTIVARVRDLVRNDGWAAGSVTRILDNAIGATFRPISKPDYRALAHRTGISAFDATWAAEYGKATDAHYRAWGDPDDPGRYCDVERSKWLSLMFGVAFRHLIVENDCIAINHWLEDRVGPGRATYATAVQLVDPDRLSNPNYRFDMTTTRGGVELDAYGAAVGYHIRRAHQGDWWAAGDQVMWDYVEREDEYGRPIVVHYFEPERAGQHRGGNGVFTPVLTRAKMLFKMDTAELDGALLNAIFAAVAESPFDPELMKDALGGDEEALGGVNSYQDGRGEFYKGDRVKIAGSKIVQAYPGEKLTFIKPDRPNPNFAPFEKAVLRNIASALGLASHQVTGDYSDANYSSMRAALLEAWKTIHRRRHNFGKGFCGPIRTAWLEEAFEIHDLPLPNGAPEFYEMRGAYSRCVWMGPGRGWVDPVAEKQGAILGINGGLSTLQMEAAEGSGEDWEDIADQKQIEMKGYESRGLTFPDVTNMQAQGDNSKPPQKP